MNDPRGRWRYQRQRVADVLTQHLVAREKAVPGLCQARRALDLARTEDAIRDAIASAPPLSAETMARLHSLIPALHKVAS